MKEKLLVEAKKTKIFKVVSKIDDRGIGFNPVGINSVDWVTMIVEKNGQFLMERQLRYGLMKVCEEFPSGMIERYEEPIDAAVRELAEETGIAVEKADVRYLGKFAANPAFMNNYMHYFYVNLDNSNYIENQPNFDEHEQISSFWKDRDQVIKDYMVSNTSVFMAGAFWLMCYDQIQNENIK